MIQTVIQFCENDEYSQLCPGKNFVSVKHEVEEATYRERVPYGPELYDLQKLYGISRKTLKCVSWIF
jgi:hypothetical protein